MEGRDNSRESAWRAGRVKAAAGPGDGSEAMMTATDPTDKGVVFDV